MRLWGKKKENDDKTLSLNFYQTAILIEDCQLKATQLKKYLISKSIKVLHFQSYEDAIYDLKSIDLNNQIVIWILDKKIEGEEVSDLDLKLLLKHKNKRDLVANNSNVRTWSHPLINARIVFDTYANKLELISY